MGIAELYDFYWNQCADPRTNHLPFVSSPILIPTIIFTYLYFVLKYGPEYMKDRKPYKLKTFIKYYNVFQIIANACIVQQFISVGWFTEISVFCELPDYSYKPGPYKLAHIMWLGTIMKLIDLVETVVFVLRKKDSQVSFLHLYHHISTLLLSWYITRYYAIAMASFTLLVNCTVHVIMYTYYLFSAFGDNAQKLLNPFKPLLTITQMAQFVILLLQHSQSFLPSCPVSRVPGTISGINLIMNFVLFYNFYQRRYKPQGKKS
ncbi:elongation of very long chain fatty acids protein 1-like [Hylaeus volcanicus]|uniref:elongation of very long chain fatty acids protein 1-like n=1 Tax=Hylaeus volcanicus TaxID=313075 RepID=UPI0023B842AC|nr:elongation of very long chain fatty acids protein 1-like [Hylaeus volcanicus]